MKWLAQRVLVRAQTEAREALITHVIEGLKERWGVPASACPYCSVANWQVGGELLRFETEHYITTPFLVVICGGCGHTIWLDAAKAVA